MISFAFGIVVSIGNATPPSCWPTSTPSMRLHDGSTTGFLL